MKVAENNPNSTFVVAGKLDTKYFSDNTCLENCPNIITTGYITDSEMKSLMKHSKAFLYPSIYEGFGMPPMEAMSVGTKAIVGKASCLPEVYGDSVYYIDPWKFDINLSDLLSNKVSDTESLLRNYSWNKTANAILERIRK